MIASKQGFVNFRFRFDLLHLAGKHCSVYILKKRKFILRSLQCVSCIIGKDINMISFIFQISHPGFRIICFLNCLIRTAHYLPDILLVLRCSLYHLIYIILLSLAASVSLIPGIALKYHFCNFITLFFRKTKTVQISLPVIFYKNLSNIKNNILHIRIYHLFIPVQ